MNRRYFKPLLVLLAILLSTSSYVSAKSLTNDGGYTAKDKEFYLDATFVAFIRPGLEIKDVSISIPDDRQPLVTYTLADPGGLPLDIDGVFTPGPVDMRYMLTRIPTGETQKLKYTAGSRDSGGTLTALGNGVYTYKFATVLPEDYPVDATHTLGLVGRRDLREFDLERYVSNVVHNFVPSGNSAPAPRDIVTTETCNGRCHDPLAIHGGRYREVEICTQCHNPALFSRSDPTVSRSFDVLIHDVHGRDEVHYPVPLNDCEVCHTGGTPTADFPLVANPAPIPVCDQSGRGATDINWAVTDLTEIRLRTADGPLFASVKDSGSATTGKWVGDGLDFLAIDRVSRDTLQTLKVNTTVFGCVGNAPGTFRGTAGVQHTNWMTNPSRRVCGSCHDDVDFETGLGHSEFNFPQPDDTICNVCHVPSSGAEYDRSVDGAHTVTYKSNQLPGIFVKVAKVEFTGPGEFPMVTFGMSDKNGPIDPNDLTRLRISFVGPNTDFVNYWQDNAVGAVVNAKDAFIGADATEGLAPGKYWSWTSTQAMPADAAGSSYTVMFEGRKAEVLNAGTDKEMAHNNQMQNPTFAFAVTAGDVAVPRRTIVDDNQCEDCHSNLSLHGSNRHQTDYCVSCHRPDATDVAQRDEGDTPQGINFPFLVHRLHSGVNLAKGFVVKGYMKSTHDYSALEYPGDRRNCGKCHKGDSYMLPLPLTNLATVAPLDPLVLMPPATAACLGCHDKLSTAAHAEINISTPLGESCVQCHGPGKDHAVEKVHAR